MLYDFDITGRTLPAGVLALTFDDGPDLGTLALAEDLADERIPATFFVVGRAAARHPSVVARLAALGHDIGNHTFDHPSLPAFTRRGGDPVAQLQATADLLTPWVRRRPILFRAPYGAWRVGNLALSDVAARLNQAPVAASHLGPIHWDIAPGDWWFWRHDATIEACGRVHLEQIREARRGIVLLHDSTADDETTRRKNQTLALVRWLVPRLRADGFTFVPLREVPEIQRLATAIPTS